ncbi:TonB-dependent receptor [Rhodoferax sp. BAB1]|uniref:TonB-dependent receptor family protein n=1 Tax=Rhodoferax sp. BAB1 TaxID=2741720 RepID=UPI0015752131|nr:TonB-dependent receptor [Rhodoferax sp. BAB1]QKO23015.1 TonB-dependent receptor [Rhodoferax sp. BAB1]
MKQTNKPGLRPMRTALALLVTGLGAVPAWGQTLEDVVISASRAQQRSFDAPAAIEAVERETIQNAGPQINLSESLNRVPGLTILNRQNYAQDLQVSIRGFGARSAFGIRGIRLLIDGIPATTPDGQGQGSSIALTSTERIEVLRGPLALMYGNSAGGVIQAFTREAPEVPEFGAQLYTGSYDMRRTDWQYAGRLGAGPGGVGLVADYGTFSTDGYRDNSAAERKQFNGKLSFGPDAGTRVNVVFNQFDMPLAEDPLGLTAAQLAADPTQAGTNAVDRRVRKIVTQSQVGTSVIHQLGADRSVTARVYYGARDNLQFQSGNTWVGLDRGYYGLGLQYNALSRLGATPMRWVAGYEFDRSREYREGGVAALGEKTSTTRSEDNQAENSDVFVQGTALLSERWSMVGGLRHSTVRFVSEDYYLADGRDGSGQVSYQASNPVLGVTWHAADTMNLYANYGKGFETPTLAEVAYRESGGAVLAEFNPTLRAATSRHYEAGLKWVPTAGSRLDFTVFHITTSDEVVVARNSFGQTAYTNAPGTERRGVELSGRTLVHPKVSLSLAATAIDARYSQSFTYISAGTPFTVLADNRLPGIPQNFIFSELLWTSQAQPSARAAQRMGTRAGVEIVSAGRLYANDTNTASAEGYTVFNLKASQAWAAGRGRLTAYARIDNAGGERYVGSVIVNQAASQFYEPAPGRNWTLGARLDVPL